MKLLPLALLLSFALCFAQPGHPAQAPGKKDKGAPVALALLVEKGAVFRFESTTETKQTGSMQGQSAEVRIRIVRDLSCKVLEEPIEGPVRFEITCDHAVLSITTPTGKVEFDSTKPPAEIPPEFATLVQLTLLAVGQPVEVHVDRHGNVVKVLNFAKIFEGTESAKQYEAKGEAIADEGALDEFQPYFVRLPEEEVKQGSTWTSNSDENLLGVQIAFRTEARLVKLRDKDAKIDFGTTSSVAEKRAKPASEGAAKKPTFKTANASVTNATAFGTATVSCADGLAIEHVIERTIQATVPNPDGGEAVSMVMELRTVTKRSTKPAKKKK